MSDIRFSSLPTTATSSASDDFIAIDGAANGTRKFSAYSPTFGGNLTVNGSTTLAQNSWINSSDALNRIYFQGLSTSYWKGHGTGVVHEFRNAADTALLQISNAGAATLAGNLTVSGTGTSSVAGPFTAPNLTVYDPSNTFAASFRGTGAANTLVAIGTVTGGAAINAYTSTFSSTAALLLQPNGGNLLLGTTIESSNGRLQLATHTTSAGGIGFGTDTSLFRTANGAGFLGIIGSGNNVGTSIDFGYTNGSGVAQTGIGYIGVAGAAGSLATGTAIGDTVLRGANSLKLASGGGTVALTLDSSQNSTFFGKIITSFAIGASASDSSTTTIQSGSSSGVKSNILLRDSWNGSNNNNAYFAVQLGDGSTTSDALRIDYQKNATFAGTIKPQQAATASAPSYVKGAIYFDTTLNKLRVGGATGWETITSV